MRPLVIGSAALGAAAVVVGAHAAASRLRENNHRDPQPPAEIVPPAVIVPPNEVAPPAPIDADPFIKTDHAGFEQAITEKFAGRAIPEHELTLPPAGTELRGVMVTIHGGAWVWVGPGLVRAMDADVKRWNERGFATVNIDYAAGAASMDDVLSFYDAVRQWQGPDVPIAATGASAGGHLSMYIAAKRPDLSFVVSHAGPSDLTRLAGATKASQDIQVAVDTLFGVENLSSYSPAHNTAAMGARILAANAENDQLVLPDQAAYMQQARPDLVETMILKSGDRPYVHANVAQESLDTLYQAESDLAHNLVGDR